MAARSRERVSVKVDHLEKHEQALLSPAVKLKTSRNLKGLFLSPVHSYKNILKYTVSSIKSETCELTPNTVSFDFLEKDYIFNI